MDPRTITPELTEYEAKIGIAANCRRPWRCLMGEYGTPASVSMRGGWWSTDDVTRQTGHADDGCKTRKLQSALPDKVERAYLDRKTGKIYRDRPGDAARGLPPAIKWWGILVRYRCAASGSGMVLHRSVQPTDLGRRISVCPGMEP